MLHSPVTITTTRLAHFLQLPFLLDLLATARTLLSSSITLIPSHPLPFLSSKVTLHGQGCCKQYQPACTENQSFTKKSSWILSHIDHVLQKVDFFSNATHTIIPSARAKSSKTSSHILELSHPFHLVYSLHPFLNP